MLIVVNTTGGGDFMYCVIGFNLGWCRSLGRGRGGDINVNWDGGNGFIQGWESEVPRVGGDGVRRGGLVFSRVWGGLRRHGANFVRSVVGIRRIGGRRRILGWGGGGGIKLNRGCGNGFSRGGGCGARWAGLGLAGVRKAWGGAVPGSS